MVARDWVDLGAHAVDDMEGLDADLDGEDHYDDDYEENEKSAANIVDVRPSKLTDDAPVQQIEHDVASRGSMELWNGSGEGATARPSPNEVANDVVHINEQVEVEQKQNDKEEEKDDAEASPDSDLVGEEIEAIEAKPSRGEVGSKHSDSPPPDGEAADDVSEDDYEDDFD